MRDRRFISRKSVQLRFCKRLKAVADVAVDLIERCRVLAEEAGNAVAVIHLIIIEALGNGHRAGDIHRLVINTCQLLHGKTGAPLPCSRPEDHTVIQINAGQLRCIHEEQSATFCRVVEQQFIRYRLIANSLGLHGQTVRIAVQHPRALQNLDGPVLFFTDVGERAVLPEMQIGSR